jgi:hypothetical protein
MHFSTLSKALEVVAVVAANHLPVAGNESVTFPNFGTVM